MPALVIDTGQTSHMETISFALTFSSNWIKHPPIVSIRNDNITIVEPTEIDSVRVIEFALTITTEQAHTLEIIRSNHDEVHDQLCRLDQFQADNLDITEVLDHGRFYPIYPRLWYMEQQAKNIHWPEYHDRWREWGWNGTWQLRYQAPFFSWLLKII